MGIVYLILPTKHQNKYVFRSRFESFIDHFLN